jgi:hypothetical protein
MLRFGSMVATAALLFSADVSGVIHLRRPASKPVEIPSSENLPVLPDMSPAKGQDQGAQKKSTTAKSNKNAGKNTANNPADKKKIEPLQPESRLALVRFVDGEFVDVVQPLPAGKKGIHLKAGVPFDEKQLRTALGSSGSAINPGDKAQITDMEFKDREIIVDVNGGGRGKKRLRDRIHLEIGGVPSMAVTQPDAPVQTDAGATIFLDFDNPLPEMTPDELKQDLSALLDFSSQHSAAFHWIDTLPPDIQKAIQDKRAAVGMDREMVVAAIGRPDHKVREKGPDGNETEDWIYGQPPGKTVFVKFEGDKVTQVEQFPR